MYSTDLPEAARSDVPEKPRVSKGGHYLARKGSKSSVKRRQSSTLGDLIWTVADFLLHCFVWLA